MYHFWNTKIFFKQVKIYLILTYLKTKTLHDEGNFLKFRKNGQKKFPTHEEKKKRFEN